MANLYVTAVPPTDLNRNTEWFMYPGVWTTYILILFFCWLLVLSLASCSPGMAWTVVNLSHFLIASHYHDKQGLARAWNKKNKWLLFILGGLVSNGLRLDETQVAISKLDEARAAMIGRARATMATSLKKLN